MREQANSLREEGGFTAPQHYPNLLSAWAMVSHTGLVALVARKRNVEFCGIEPQSIDDVVY